MLNERLKLGTHWSLADGHIFSFQIWLCQDRGKGDDPKDAKPADSPKKTEKTEVNV